MKKLIKFLIYLNLFVFAFLLSYKYKDVLLSLIRGKEQIIIKEANAYKRNYDYKTFYDSSDYIINSKEETINIIYNILNNGYDQMTFYCDEEYTSCFEDVTSLSNDSVLINNIGNYVNPLNGFNTINTLSDSTGKITLKVSKNYTEEEIDYINNEIDKIILSLNIEDNSIEDKIIKVHNYIIQNVKYDDNLNKSKAIDALRDKTATCNGYASLFAIFMDKLSIPNFLISSDTHLWNAVYVNNEWKHVDVTWDDTNEKISTLFMLITTDKLLELDNKEHNFDNTFYKELIN